MYSQNSYNIAPNNVDLESHSICCRVPFKEGFSLVRCADIKQGVVVPFYSDPAYDARCSNRKYFSPKQPLTGQENPWGVWDLQAVSRPEGKDFYSATAHKGSLPIVVHRLRLQTTAIEQLTDDILRQEFNFPGAFPVLFTYRKGKALYGIYIRPDQVKENEGKFRLNNVWSLPQYELDENAIVELTVDKWQEPKSFWRYLSLAQHSKLLPERLNVISPASALAETIFETYGSWNQFQTAFADEKKDHKDHKIFRTLINLLKNDSIRRKLDAHYQLSDDEFKKIKNQVIEQASDYFNGVDIETEVLLNAALRRQEVRKNLEEGAERRWKSEHQQEISQAENSLEETQEKLKKGKNELAELQTKISAEKTKLEKTKAQTASAEKTAQTISDKIQESIQNAQSKVLNLLADLPITLALQQMLADSSRNVFVDRNSPTHGNEILAVTNGLVSRQTTSNSNHAEKAALQLSPSSKANLEISPAEDAKDWLRSASSMLRSAGVVKTFAAGIAKISVATAIRGTPLILAGPNSCSIADMLSIALTGQQPVIANLDECTLEEVLENLNVEQTTLPPVVLFRNALTGNRLSTILDDWRLAKCTPIIASTFAEEVALYPIGLLNSAFLILTELFVNEEFRPTIKTARLKYATGNLYSDWRESPADELAVPAAIDDVPLPPLALRRHEALLSQIEGLFADDPSKDSSETFLLCLAASAVLLSANPQVVSERLKSKLLPWLRTEATEESFSVLDSWLKTFQQELAFGSEMNHELDQSN